MSSNKKHPLPPDFNNPFDNPDPNEVWKDLKKNAKPVSREEVFKNFKSKSKNKK